MSVCFPCDISGISSSITTYNIAPAAKLNRYGSAGIIIPDKTIVMIAPAGSTAPDNTHMQKLFS